MYRHVAVREHRRSRGLQRVGGSGSRPRRTRAHVPESFRGPPEVAEAHLTGDEIPDAVRRFVGEHISRVGHMEALALLVEEPGEAWTATRVAGRLYVTPGDAESLLADLARASLLTGPDPWRFAPTDPAVAERARAAIACYRQRLIPMTRLIQSRHDAATHFADAFRLRRR